MAGPRTFTGPVTAAGDVDLNGLVNKLNLTQDVVTLKGKAVSETATSATATATVARLPVLKNRQTCAI